jgi:hypothetical protein
MACGPIASLLSGFAAAQDLSTSLPGGLSIPTFQEIPSYYSKDWRDDPGLWGSNPEMRKQSWVLAAAGLDSVLGQTNTTTVLQNLRTAQEKSGNRGWDPRSRALTVRFRGRGQRQFPIRSAVRKRVTTLRATVVNVMIG